MRDAMGTDERDPGRRTVGSDEDFQRTWLASRRLTWKQVEAAFRHGLDARPRFADRPFAEVEGWLRESWDGMRTGATWEQVDDLVRSAYERFEAAGFDQETGALEPDVLRHFPLRTIGGSTLGPDGR